MPSNPCCREEILLLNDEQLIKRCALGDFSAGDIPHERLSHSVVDGIIKHDRNALREIPSNFWSDFAIGMTLFHPNLNDIYDPSLVTKKIFDETFCFNHDVITRAPSHLPDFEQFHNAAMGEIDVLPFIDAEKAQKFVETATGPEAKRLGSCVYIQDVYAEPIAGTIKRIKDNLDIDILSPGEQWVLHHRLRSAGKAVVLSECKKADAPDVYRAIYGSEEAAVAFPQAPKRKWIESDLSL